MENQSFGERICGDQGYEEFDGEEDEEDEEEEEEKAALEFLSSRQDERGAQGNYLVARCCAFFSKTEEMN